MLKYEVYLKEIVSMIERIENSMGNVDFEVFSKDIDLFDATLMRLHFIGETIKSIPYDIKRNYKNIKWKKHSRLRDIISHKYSKVNKNIIWDVLQFLPELKEQIKEILNK